MLASFFSFLCHQLPARSPCCADQFFPLCYRCAGIHFGISLVVIYWLGRRKIRFQLPDMRLAIVLAFLLSFVWVDGWANLLGLWHSPGWLRYLTGLSSGISFPLLAVPISQFAFPESASVSPSIRNVWELILLFLLGVGLLIPLQGYWGTIPWKGMEILALVGVLTCMAVIFACVRAAWAEIVIEGAAR